MKRETKIAGWAGGLGIAATLVGMLVGLKALGWVGPWSALAVQEAADTYETKEHANKMYEKFELEQMLILNDIKVELKKLNER